MQIRTDRGWIKAGLAVLVTGVLGGGVLAAGGSGPAQKVTAEGVTEKETAPAATGQGFDLGSVRPAGADEAPVDKPDPVVGDRVVMGDGSVTVSAVEDDVSAGRLFGAGDGFKYTAAEVKGCSGPNEKNITFEPAYFLLLLDDGTIRDPGVGVKKPSLDGGTVPPGKCLSGWVTFTVPEGALATGVIYDGSVRTTWTVPLPKNAKQTMTSTLRPGATTDATRSTEPNNTATTSKSTASTAKSTATTAKSSTTTAKPTGTTAKSTGTTAKPTPTTARGSTATTSKSTATTSKPAATSGQSGSTTSTAKSSGTTGSTTKSSGSTSTTSRSSGSTPTTAKSSAGTTPTSSAAGGPE